MWPSPLLALLLLRMLLPLQVHGLAFSPTNHGDRLWDTWLYRNTDPTVPQTWILNYLVKHDEPIITHGAQGWNAANTAVSTDGVHFSDVGLAIQRPCDCQDETARHTCLTNMGSSSIWRSLTNSSEFIMAYGANVSDPAVPAGQNCGVLRNASDQTSADRNASGIYFSTSTDLINWHPVVSDGYPDSVVFRAGVPAYGGNASLYPPELGPGDCIAVLPRLASNGRPAGYYGFFTASPAARAEICGPPVPNCSAADRGTETCHSCGCGLAESDDGLHWRALPTPGPPIGRPNQAELGGVCQIGGRTFMTFYNGRLFHAATPLGPFEAAAQNYEFMIDEDKSGSIFPRLWGELYTAKKDLCLITHQQCLDRNNPCYAGLVKQAVLGDDGVLRASYWPNNDVLKADALTVAPVPSDWPISPDSNYSTKLVTECTNDCVSSGLWIEGTLRVPPAVGQAVGVWLETAVGVPHSNGTTTTTGFRFLVDGSGQFQLCGSKGEAQNAGCKKLNRALGGSLLKPNATVPFLLIARNSWAGQGLAEHYVGGVLSLAQTLRGHLTGAFAAVGGSGAVNITAVHRLSLPEA